MVGIVESLQGGAGHVGSAARTGCVLNRGYYITIVPGLE